MSDEISTSSAVASPRARTVLVVGNTDNSRNRAGTPWSRYVLPYPWDSSIVLYASKIKVIDWLVRIEICPPCRTWLYDSQSDNRGELRYITAHVGSTKSNATCTS